jgi:hypothetical protein
LGTYRVVGEWKEFVVNGNVREVMFTEKSSDID